MKNCLCFIGGSGLYDLEFLDNIEYLNLSSSMGKPSDNIIKGTFQGNQIFFLSRHGKGHKLSPSSINSDASPNNKAMPFEPIISSFTIFEILFTGIAISFSILSSTIRS